MCSKGTLSGPSDWSFYRNIPDVSFFTPLVPSSKDTEAKRFSLENVFQKWFTEDDVSTDECFTSERRVLSSRPQDKQEKLLEQLLKDQKKLAKFPTFCPKLEKLLKQEISRVWEELNIKEQKVKEEEKIVHLVEKIYVSEEIVLSLIHQLIDSLDNFVGRLLSVRGQKIKQLAQSLGITMFVRGQGASKGPVTDEKFQRHLRNGYFDDKLHVVIKCEGKERLCREKMARTVETVKKIMVQPVFAEPKRTVITGKRPSARTFETSKHLPLVTLRFLE